MPVGVSSIVHTKETTGQKSSIPTYGESLRHSCRSKFLAAETTYERLDRAKDHSRAEDLRWCRSRAWFCRHTETGEVRVASNSCRLRWCPVCAQSRVNYITHEVSEWTAAQAHPKFITLTLKHTEAPLDHQVKHLYLYFQKLRRRKDFKRCVTGGIWFFQIKKSESDNLWHPHLHCLVTGLYLPRRRLSKMWQDVTYGSMVTDIRPVHDPQKAANDVARYSSSPGTLSSLDLPDACELVDAMQGRRICGTWGTGRAVSLRPARQTDKSKWTNIGNWFAILENHETSPNCRAILSAWRNKTPLPEGISYTMNDYLDRELGLSFWENLDLDEIYKPERNPP